jgi:hypothetical protein
MKHFFSLLRGSTLAALLIFLLLAGPAARAQAPAWQFPIMPTHTSPTTTAGQLMAADASGNVYVAGVLMGTATFGATTLTSSGGTDIFVAKWNGSGFVWAQRIEGPGNESPFSLVLNGTSLYLAGVFNGATATVGTTTLTKASTVMRDSDLFVAKLTDLGSTAAFTWVQQVSYVKSATLAVSGSTVYLAGSFEGNTLRAGTIILTSVLNMDHGFVAKLTDAGTTGSFVWAQLCGDAAVPAGVAVSGANVYVAGSFSRLTVPTTIGNTALTSAGSSDVFVAKLADAGSTGSYVWAQRAGGTGQELTSALAVRGNALYLAGGFTGPACSFGSTTLTSAGSGDVFVAKLTDAGSAAAYTWALRGGGAGDDLANGLAASGSSIYVTGAVGSTTASFGSTTLANPANLTNYNGLLANIADAGPTAAFAWAKQFGGAGQDVSYAPAIGGTTVYVPGYVSPPASFDGQVITTPTSGQIAVFASLTDPTLLATTTAQGNLIFTLSPNPARAAATVQLPAVPGITTATLTLRDALGRALNTETVNLPAAGLRHELDLRSLAPGLYAVQVRAGAATATRRLVVE